MIRSFTSNSNFLNVVRAVLRMYKYLADGQFDSPEADAQREEMEAPWNALSPIEQKRIDELSMDLNESFETKAIHAPVPLTQEAQAGLVEATEARWREDWDRALELLRQWGKYNFPQAIAYLRGEVWDAAGYPEVAVAFYEHACRLDPTNSSFQAARLDVLKRSQPALAREEAQRVLASSETHHPAVVVHALDIVFGVTRTATIAEATKEYKRLLPILNRTLERLQNSDLDRVAFTGMVLSLLASAHRELGDIQSAYDYYSRAIQNDPANSALLAARGLLNYGSSENSAEDLKEAIRLGVSFVWPYISLAHYYLSTNRFQECRLLCEQGLERATTNRSKSQLYEFLAIAQDGLNYHAAIIRSNFEKAVRTDPSNDSARKNLELFNEADTTKAPSPRDWEKRSSNSLRDFQKEEELLAVQ